MNNITLLENIEIARGINPSSDPRKLCENLEIELIENKELKKDGYLVCSDGCKLIFVSSKITNPHRKKFVITHELGHFFLHQNNLYSCSNISELGALSATKVNTSVQEQEANYFASEFLLPQNKLNEMLPNRDLTFSDIKYVAATFDISVTFSAIKSVQCSKTENEILLCYDKSTLQWFVSGDKTLMRKSIPNTAPISLSAMAGAENVSNVWTTLYSGAVRQEIFSPYGTQRLILLSGTRLDSDSVEDYYEV